MSGVETIEVSEADADIRLDRWFRRHRPELSHGRIEKLARTGQIRVDGHRVKASTRLKAGQKVRVPPLGPGPAPAAKPARAKADPAEVERLRRLIIHRDDDVLVLNKPPGLAVQGGTGVTRHLDMMLDGLRLGAAERPRLVHRLDKDTSGVLVLARSARAAAHLTTAFRRKGVRKVYWALTAGVPKLRRGRIDIPLSKNATAAGERVGADEETGRHATTYYAIIENAGKKAAWLALMPVTGRTHQLRVHCAALGTPILGDGKYAGKGAFLPGVPGPVGLQLHARSVEFTHPNGRSLRIEAPLPDSMLRIWRFFGLDPGEAGDPFRELET